MERPRQTIRVIDSHTGGEPTRVVVQGGPDLGGGPLAQRLVRFREEFDAWRSAVVNEPRGSDLLVGALLVEPLDKGCAAGVIFFNNVGYLGMCGHGTIGVIETLTFQGRIGPGTHRIETPVGVVTATLHGPGPGAEVSVENVVSYRKAKAARVRIMDEGGSPVEFSGDVAWSGNWFYLVEHHGLEVAPGNMDNLMALAWKLRQAINAQGYPEVDHIELFGPPTVVGANSRSFVLCPGKAYDRSPCGTGTSAKLACLAADGKLAPGQVWVQESIIGSTFKASYRPAGEGKIVPTIMGRAYITGEATLMLEEGDPFRWGIGR
jgi:4-hydroxyproline epimerase